MQAKTICRNKEYHPFDALCKAQCPIELKLKCLERTIKEYEQKTNQDGYCAMTKM